MIAQSIQLNRQDGQPLYVQIRDGVRSLVLGGRLLYGQILPSEKDLAQSMGVSRMTLRQALRELEQAGVIECRHGSGNVVRPPHFKHETLRLGSFSEDMRSRGLNPSSKVLNKTLMPAGREIAQLLGCHPRNKVLCLERLRLAGGTPVGLHTAYIPAGLLDPSAVGEGSLYEAMAGAGVLVQTAEEFIEATEATPKEARLLKVNKGNPLILITRITSDQKACPVEVVYARYRSDLYRYQVRLSRNPGGP